MVQKVIKVGNSLAVTIPSDFAKELKLRPGEKINVDEDFETKTLTVQAINTDIKKGGLTPEFLKWLKNFNNKYKDVLKELAKK